MPATPAKQAAAEAIARFEAPATEHINCGQAVLYYALLRLGEDPGSMTYARYFGGGITGMGEICGALSGAALALGVRDRFLEEQGADAPQSVADGLRTILRDFAERFGSCRCLELTGFDLSTPDGLVAFKMSEIRSRCTDYVAWAIDRLEPLVEPTEAAGSSAN